jgi:hypothetical protein
MPFEDPWLAKGQSSPLEFERRCFEETNGNPIHVWRAYLICRELTTAPQGPIVAGLPNWILHYLDRIGEHVREMFYRHDEGESINLGAELAGIMGFKDAGQGRRSTAFVDNELAQRDMSLAIDIRHALGAEGVNPETATPAQVDDAIENVLEDCRVLAESYRAAIDSTGKPWRASQRQELDRLALRAKLSDSTLRRAWQKRMNT